MLKRELQNCNSLFFNIIPLKITNLCVSAYILTFQFSLLWKNQRPILTSVFLKHRYF